MKNYFAETTAALVHVAIPVITGVWLGFFVATQMQERLNQSQRTECANSDYRRVVSLQTVLGTAEYCLPIKYLASP